MERSAAYRRKLDVIVDCLGKLSSVASFAQLRPLEREGVLHVVQVAVDAALDAAAMVVKDEGDAPSDDYHNLEKLAARGVLSAKMTDDLRRLNGLRNAIVHKYNSFEEARVFESLDEIASILGGFAEIVEARL